MITNNKIEYTPCEIEQLQRSCKQKHIKNQIIYSMRDFLAKKNANQIWGNNYTFEAESEDIVNAFNEFATKNRLLPLFKFIERELSLNGRVIVVLNKNKKGELKINVANPFFYAAIGKVFVNEELAVIWQRVILDTGTFYVKSTYDTEKCVNQIFDESNQMVVYDAVKEIGSLGIEPVWYHNLGFVPVVEITNYPLFQFQNIMFAPEAYYQVADWYPASFFEESFYQLWKNLNKEVIYCHSRIAIESANQTLIKQINEQTKFQNDIGDDVIGDYVIETETGGKAQVIPGVADFSKYTTAMDAVMDFYFKFANSSRFSDGGGAQKTTSEANQSNSSQIETLEAKIKHREYEYTMLIAKILAALGKCVYEDVKEYPFSFKINGNIQKNDNAYLDFILKQVQSGTMSLVEAIAQLRGVSLSKSQQIFEQIKEFNEENDVVVSTMMNEEEQMGFASDGFEQGGRPTENGDN